MSVINQVLNQLEQRGANTAPEQTMVRAVPPVRRSLLKPALLVLVLIAAGSAAWLLVRKPAAVVPNVTRPASAAISAEENGLAMLPPASRLSFELNSVPLPTRLPEPKNSTAPKSTSVPPPSSVPDNLQTPPAAIPNAPAVQASIGDLPIKQISRAQQADAEFRRGVALMQQGRIAEAIGGYEAALQLDAGHHAARQALVALLLEGKRGADAERVLQEGLKIGPDQIGFAMLLARLQVERGAVDQAMATLDKSLPYAGNLADYQAFIAALFQRQGRHKEAVDHYQLALQLVPNNGVWLMGYGISLQGLQRNTDAKEAFMRALDSQTLSPELQKFVQQKLKVL
ncbi:MAG TPA: tetratricopeptide repeat protein [Gallionella sp.]|nr:tetratricopeptide repeat protein [Gallionella sp.]